jgi:methionine aminopeptidase
MDETQATSSLIHLYSPDDFAGMRRAGQLAAATLDFITHHVKPDVVTAELDELMQQFMEGRRGEGATLKEGMIFTVEPMFNAGRHSVKILSDGRTAVTRDKSLSAQLEHTVGVTKDGCEIFTLSAAGYSRLPYLAG